MMKATPIPQFGEWTADNGGNFTGLFEKKKEEKLSTSGFVGTENSSSSSPARSNGSWNVARELANGMLGLENFSGGSRHSNSASPPHGGPMSPIIPKFGEWPQSSASYTAEFEANLREAKSRSKLTTALGNPDMRKFLSEEELDWLRNIDGSAQKKPGQEKVGRSGEGKVVPVSAETVRGIGFLENDTKISSSTASQSSTPSGSRSPVVVPAFGSWSTNSSPSYTATFEAKKREAYAAVRRDVHTETGKDTSRRSEDTNLHRDELREGKNGKTKAGKEGEQREGQGDEDSNSVKVGVSKTEKDKEGVHSEEAGTRAPLTLDEMLDDHSSVSEDERDTNKESQEVSVPHFDDWESPCNSTSYTAKFQQNRAARAAGGLYGGIPSSTDGKASPSEERRKEQSQNGEGEHSSGGELPVQTEREGSGEKPGSHNRPAGRSKISLEDALRVAEKEGKVAPAQKPPAHVAPMGNWNENQGAGYTSMLEKVRNDRRERGVDGKANATTTTASTPSEKSIKSPKNTAQKEKKVDQPECCVIL